MTQEQLITELFKIDLIADLTAVVLFTAVYTVLAPWWRNPVGRTLVVLDILLGLAVIPSLLSLFFQFSRLTSYLAAWFDTGIFALIALALLQRIPLWIRLHRSNQEEPGDGEES